MWPRRFQFFDKELVPEENVGPDTLTMQQVPATCATSGRGTIILGDSSGCVTLVDRNLKTTPFLAYSDNVSQMVLVRDRNLLVTSGHDEDGITTVKVFAMDKLDANGVPPPVQAVRIDIRGYPTCLAASADFDLVAIGLANGAVAAITGDIMRSPRVVVVRPAAGSETVTGLAIRGRGKESLLYVATSGGVFAYAGVPAGGTPEETLLDPNGAEMGCVILTDEGELVVGTREAVWFFHETERGQCLGFEGEKKMLHWFRGGHLLVVGTDVSSAQVQTKSAADAGMARLNAVSIYDTKNKLVAFTEARFGNVTQVLSEWGAIFVFTADHKVFKLVEKDTQTKLETLFNKNLYSVAVGIASNQQFDAASIANIFTKYGDHLYKKGDYDGAIQQFNRTIGYLEPSYVIRKFLDAQRIHNLTSYLEELHKLGRANTDHTTLLLNCYTKLKDVTKLEQFLKTDSKEANFDVETAIKVCRQAGFHSHALELSRKYQQHDWYLKIQIDDLQQYTAALDYIASLPIRDAEENIKNYGKTLVTMIPQDTTKLLMRLCTDYVPSGGAVASKGDTRPCVPDEFIHIFVGQPKWLAVFLESVVAAVPKVSSFLYDTLLELYLRAAEGETKEEAAERLRRAEELLSSKEPRFDPHHALVLCQRHDYRQGVMLILEHLKLYQEIMQQHMETKDFANLIACCKRYAERDPNLWMQVLSYFSTIPDDCEKEIAEVLLNIERNNLMPPLLVIQVLANKPTMGLSAVKEYIVRRLQGESRSIAEDEREIRTLREETEKMRAEITELRTKPHTFQSSKCTYCSAPLDYPAIHFLCNHSFHQRCLTENERECPLCTPANRKILDISKSMQEKSCQHEQFFKSLESAPDGFSTVAEYFGRGIFSNIGATGKEAEAPAEPASALSAMGMRQIAL